MKTQNTDAAKAATKRTKSTTSKEVKSTTANVTSKEVDAALVEQTAQVISNDLKKQKKSQPTAEELAAKAAKAAISKRDRLTDKALNLTKSEICDVANWLKVTKRNFDKSIAKQLDSKWAELCVNTKKFATGSYVVETTTKTDKEGKEHTLYAVHMVKFVPTDKIGSKTILCKKPSAFYYCGDKEETKVSTLNDLTIQRQVVESEKITKVIDGVEYFRNLEKVVTKSLKPYEVLDLTYGEFKKGFKAAMEISFPNGFAE